MKKSIPINDNWLFRNGFDNECFDQGFDFAGSYIVSLPHCAAETGGHYFSEEDLTAVSTYIRRIFIPSEYNGSKIVIRFEGILSYAEVYVNGIFVTSHKGETPFEADITAPVQYDFDNRIVVKTDSGVRPDVPSFGVRGPALQYGGIFRDVSLRIESGECIKDVFIRTPDVLSETKTVEIDVELSDYYPETTVEAEFSDASGRVVGRIAPKAVLRRTTTLKGQIESAMTWDTDFPTLYIARVSLRKKNSECDAEEIKFGFRKVEFRRGAFCLNGVPKKLIGLNRFDSFAYCGRAMPESRQREDARILKEELGCNVVRTHGLASRDFIDECDRIGLLVIEDVSGDGYVGKDRWRDAFVETIADTVKRDRNSPSVIAWGVRVNNSRDFDELYFKANKAAKDLDPTRQTLGARNFMGSRMYEDVFGYNDYSKKRTLSRLVKTGKLFVPYIITEHTGKSYPTKPYDNESRRLEHTLRHLRVMEKTLKSRKISGAIGMSFTDFDSARRLGSGDNTNYYGVTDIFRMPKTAAAAYSSQFSQKPYLALSSTLAPDEFTGKLYAFTNCDYVKLYRGETEIGEFRPDNKEFKCLPHPPIIIDEFTGDLTQSEGFTPFQAKLFRRVLKGANKRGLLNLGFADKLCYMLLKNGLKTDFDGIRELVDKYSLTSPSRSFSVEGYIGGEAAVKKKVGGSKGKRLNVSPQSDKIVCTKSYEVIKVELTMTDDDGNVLEYDFSPVFLGREGAVDIIGPESISLIAGRGAFYVRSLIGGAGSVTVLCGGETEILDLEVIYESVERL